jgi:integrase
MAVYKRGGIWWYKFRFNGELIRSSTKQSNKRVAEQIEAARRTALAKGEVGIVERKRAPTLSEFADRFLQTIRTDCADRPATVSFYESKAKILRHHPVLAKCRLDRVDEAVIDAYKQSRTKQRTNRQGTLSTASVNRELATLRRLLRVAQQLKIIDRVPPVKLLRGERTREFVLSHEQEAVFLDALPPDLRDVETLMLDTGLRTGEALSLDWSAVRLQPANNAKYGYLTVTAKKAKNSKSRNVPLTERVASILRARLRQDVGGYVFQREGGRKLSQTRLNHQHQEIRDRLKLPAEFVPHSLRHTFGTRLGEAGADAFTIMKLMGHSSITISQRYVHPSPESLERAIERFENLNATSGRTNAQSKSRVGTNLGTAVRGPAQRRL